MEEDETGPSAHAAERNVGLLDGSEGVLVPMPVSDDEGGDGNALGLVDSDGVSRHNWQLLNSGAAG